LKLVGCGSFRAGTQMLQDQSTPPLPEWGKRATIHGTNLVSLKALPPRDNHRFITRVATPPPPPRTPPAKQAIAVINERSTNLTETDEEEEEEDMDDDGDGDDDDENCEDDDDDVAPPLFATLRQSTTDRINVSRDRDEHSHPSRLPTLPRSKSSCIAMSQYLSFGGHQQQPATRPRRGHQQPPQPQQAQQSQELTHPHLHPHPPYLPQPTTPVLHESSDNATPTILPPVITRFGTTTPNSNSKRRSKASRSANNLLQLASRPALKKRNSKSLPETNSNTKNTKNTNTAKVMRRNRNIKRNSSPITRSFAKIDQHRRNNQTQDFVTMRDVDTYSAVYHTAVCGLVLHPYDGWMSVGAKVTGFQPQSLTHTLARPTNTINGNVILHSLLIGVGDELVVDMHYNDILSLIRHSPRPIKLTFYPPPNYKNNQTPKIRMAHQLTLWIGDDHCIRFSTKGRRIV